MLATPASDLADIARTMPDEFFVEDKFDGIRAQVHAQDGRVEIYSRTLDEISIRFPELHQPLSELPTDVIIDGEIITAVSFPIPEKAAYQKFKQPASRFALVGVFVSKGKQGVRVAVTGAGPVVFRVKALEDKLAASWSAAACDSVKLPPNGLNTDLHGSADYRAALIPVLAGRAVAAA